MINPPVVLILALLAQVAAPEGQWTVEKRADAMTDHEIRSAQVVNADGFTFKIYRMQPGGKVWANFALPSDAPEVLDTQLPLYRIDKLEAVQIAPASPSVQAMTGPTVEAQPKWVNFLVWAGQGTTPTRGVLRDFMDGSSVLFRYYVFGGGYKETRFNLIGAKPAIAEALQIAPDPAPGATELADARGRASLRCAVFSATGKVKLLDRCLDITTICSKAVTAADFEECLEVNQFSKLFQK